MMQGTREMRITHVLKKAVYRKTIKLLKEGWRKNGEVKKTSVSKNKKEQYFIYSQDLVRQ